MLNNTKNEQKLWRMLSQSSSLSSARKSSTLLLLTIGTCCWLFKITCVSFKFGSILLLTGLKLLLIGINGGLIPIDWM